MDEKAIIADFEKKYLHLPSPIDLLHDLRFEKKKITVYLKRDDLIHPIISGNKWRKIKGNLLHFFIGNYDKLITFGGAYSNHIYAMAAVSKFLGIQVEAFIRGEELSGFSSSTLQFAAESGLKLHFVSRTTYRELREMGMKHPLLANESGAFILPEGGTSPWALAGFSDFYDEILSELGFIPDYIIVPLGSGGTMAGIIAECPTSSHIYGICVLKGATYLESEIKTLLQNTNTLPASFEILWDLHHGGYAKSSPMLKEFIQNFKANEFNFDIEPMYSAKMMFGFYEYLLDKIPMGSSVLLVHTGGLRDIF